MQTNRKICVLGDGGWGTALSILLSKKGLSVSLWGAFPEYIISVKKSRENSKFLSGFKLPDNIVITSDADEALSDSAAVVMAIPSQYLRSTLERFKKSDFKNKHIISVVKGIENKTFKRPSQIIRDKLGSLKITVLSGPTIACEIAKGLPASCVAASEDENSAKQAQDIFISELFRVYTSSDVIGVELGGALKNIIAIAAGISDGLGLGTNAKAALFTRGLVEMKRIGVALGAEAETFNGLSGIGDLLTTCISPYSRNRTVGEKAARGISLKDLLKEMVMVAEGIETCRSVYELAKKKDIDVPITEQVYKVLFKGKRVSLAVNDLMLRNRKSE